MNIIFDGHIAATLFDPLFWMVEKQMTLITNYFLDVGHEERKHIISETRWIWMRRIKKNCFAHEILELAVEYGKLIDFLALVGLAPCRLAFEMLNVLQELLDAVIAKGFKKGREADAGEREMNAWLYRQDVSYYGMTFPVWLANALDPEESGTFTVRLEKVCEVVSDLEYTRNHDCGICTCLGA